MAHQPLSAEEVRERLGFARTRKKQLLELNGGDLPGADPPYRQQLVQEFFFHLVGAIEVLAQLINEARHLGLDVECASASAVIRALRQGDALQAALTGLYASTRPGKPVPTDLYSDEGLIYRIWNYRHQVTHRRRQPFQFHVGIGTAIDFGPGLRGRWREFRYRRNPDPDTRAPARSAHFILDPRQPPGTRTASMHSVPAELDRMLEFVSSKCEHALALI